MKIETEPSRMSKRQRKWYDKGRTAGIQYANNEYEYNLVKFHNRGWELEASKSREIHKDNKIQALNGEVAELKRHLQFAEDRIEQLQNSVVIIRDVQQ
jgi:predicted RNase H-like nuclease (RuvC/YqgF family)